jgi:hypothetical protein
MTDEPISPPKRHYRKKPGAPAPGSPYKGVPWTAGKSPRARTDDEILEALSTLGTVSEYGRQAMLAVLGEKRLSYKEAAELLGKRQGSVSTTVLSLSARIGGPNWMYDPHDDTSTLVVKNVPNAIIAELHARCQRVVDQWNEAHPTDNQHAGKRS